MEDVPPHPKRPDDHLGTYALDSSFAKAARAEEHLKALHAEASAWLDGKPYGIEQIRQDPVLGMPGPVYFEFNIASVRPPPILLSIILGDFLTNLRAALDHATWQLVCRSLGHEPEGRLARSIQFPIEKRYSDFRDKPTVRQLGISERRFIQRHQPYRRRHSPSFHPLAVLSDLVNRDKHQTVHLALTAIKKPGPQFTAIEGLISKGHVYAGRPLEAGTHFASFWLDPTGPHSDVEVQFIPVEVLFGDRPPIRFAFLDAMRRYVNRILLDCADVMNS